MENKLTTETLEKYGFQKVIGFYRLKIVNGDDEWLLSATPHDNESFFIINVDYCTDEIYQGGLDDFKIQYVEDLDLIFKLFKIKRKS